MSEPYRLLDLFSGLGAFSLGLERASNFKTVAFCEIEPFARRILAKHWPETPCYDDIRELTADRLRADGIAVDAIAGGWPCQDISIAGLGKGLAKSLRAAGVPYPLNAWSEILLKIMPPKDDSDHPAREAYLTGERAYHYCRTHLRIRNGRLELVQGHWRGNPDLGVKRARYRLEA